jgi:hypothetical protein
MLRQHVGVDVEGLYGFELPVVAHEPDRGSPGEPGLGSRRGRQIESDWCVGISIQPRHRELVLAFQLRPSAEADFHGCFVRPGIADIGRLEAAALRPEEAEKFEREIAELQEG